MRICKEGYLFRKVGTEQKKRKGLTYKEMTPEQRRKVDKIRRKAAEVNQDGRIFQGAETIAY